MSENWWKYLLMIVLGMFLMYQCGSDLKPDTMNQGDFIPKQSYDSINKLYANAQEKVNQKQIIIDLLERKADSIQKVKNTVQRKYDQVKRDGRITIVENPCNTDSILHAYDNLTNHCDSLNVMNDVMLNVVKNQAQQCDSLVSYKDTMLNTQKRIIEFKDKDFKVSEYNNEALKNENRKLKIKNIIVTSAAILSTVLIVYSIIKK